MNRFEEALVHSLDAAGALARKTNNARHRAVLNNYRTHVHLEGSGQFEKKVDPADVITPRR